MRLPIILALIVIITLPKDVRGFVDDVSAQARVATASITHFLDRNRDDDTIQVAEARLSDIAKASSDTAKAIASNVR